MKGKYAVQRMGESSEYEHRRKLNKIRENVNKRVKDIRDHFAKIEKIKVDALKKTEEMRWDADRDIAKVEEDIAKSEGLSKELREKLASDIASLKSEIEKRSDELRDRISKVEIP